MTELLLDNGDFVTFFDLCGYDAMLDEVFENGLPGDLPDGGQFVSSLDVTLLQDESAVEPLPVGTNLTVTFMIPVGMEGESFSILRWDGGQWVGESVSVADGYATTTTNHTGTFVLVVN
jgi:hypothetical protein